MAFVLKKHGSPSKGGYVQRPGSLKSYGGLENAERYDSRASALRNACGNESAIEI